MHLNPETGRAGGVSPGDRVVPRNRAGRMIQRAQHRVSDFLKKIELGAEPGQFRQLDDSRIDAEFPVDAGPPACRPHCRIGMGKGQMSALGIHDVDA